MQGSITGIRVYLVGEALPAWMQVLEQCREQLPVAFHGLTQKKTR